MAKWYEKMTDAVGLTNVQGKQDAVNAAAAALEAAKSSADNLNADTQALLNPNIDRQINAAVDAVMGQYGATGNLYGSGTQRAVGNAARTEAEKDWHNAAQRALQMQQGNAQITAGIGANNIALENSRGMLGEVGSILNTVFG